MSYYIEKAYLTIKFNRFFWIQNLSLHWHKYATMGFHFARMVFALNLIDILQLNSLNYYANLLWLLLLKLRTKNLMLKVFIELLVVPFWNPLEGGIHSITRMSPFGIWMGLIWCGMCAWLGWAGLGSVGWSSEEIYFLGKGPLRPGLWAKKPKLIWHNENIEYTQNFSN